jgi:hypothetical protein
MNDDPLRAYRRWQALEEDGHEDEADRAFEGLFKSTVQPLAPSRDFTARTMAAVGAAAVRDARHARRVRTGAVVGGVTGSVAAAYFAAGYVLTAVTSVFVGFIDLLVVAVVNGAGAMQSGIDLWSIAASLGGAAAALAGDPRVAVGLVMIQGIAIAAFIALRRLLGSDVELLK